MASKEHALMVLSSEFERNGLVIPDGLQRLLKDFKRKENESMENMRSRIYKRLWCLMWFGSKIGECVVAGANQKPTYVYPACVKQVIRAIVPGELADYEDPTGPRVYQVKLEDMSHAKWPASKKK